MGAESGLPSWILLVDSLLLPQEQLMSPDRLLSMQGLSEVARPYCHALLSLQLWNIIIAVLDLNELKTYEGRGFAPQELSLGP
jgi:hypothetical protein